MKGTIRYVLLQLRETDYVLSVNFPGQYSHVPDCLD